MSDVQVLHGHVLDRLRELPDASVQTCVTSPPYYGLRAYGTARQVWGGLSTCEHFFDIDGHCYTRQGPLGFGQTELGQGCGAWFGELGQEPTPELYIEHLVLVFREVHRVLRDDGTLWLNLGDSVARTNRVRWNNTMHRRAGWKADQETRTSPDLVKAGYKPKDLVGIPWMAAFALRDDGWFLRMDNIWAKGVSGQKELTAQLQIALRKAHLSPDQVHRVLAHMEPYVGNCMPESVKDRPTKSHEYVFLLSKSADYYCDMNEVREESGWGRINDPKWQASRSSRNASKGAGNRNAASGGFTGRQPEAGRNRRSVWLIPPVPFKGAHFATMPPALAETCIKAGTSPKGQCPVCGAPWEATVIKGKVLEAQQAASGADSQGEYHGQGQKDYEAGRAQNPSDVKRRILAGMRERVSVWGPSCRCTPADMPVPGPSPQVVLDPFGGSGTTAMVATRLGRRAITIELNDTYLPLIEQRVAKGK